MSNPSDPEPQTPQTPEEIRREMRKRFDTANTDSEAVRQQRRDKGSRSKPDDNQRWLRPQDAPPLESAKDTEERQD